MNISSSTHFSAFQHPAARLAESQGSNQSKREQTLPPVIEANKAENATERQTSNQTDVQVTRQVEVEHEKKQQQDIDVAKQLRDQQLINQLKARDREVRAHEAAHAAVGGQHAGAPTYTFQRGPNGVSYAVGGEVSISTSVIEGNPEATLQKAQQIQRAALAPAEPSTQDRRVAAEAIQMAQQARVEISQLEAERNPLRAEKSAEKDADNTITNHTGDTATVDNKDQEPNQSIADVPSLLAKTGINQKDSAGTIIDQLA